MREFVGVMSRAGLFIYPDWMKRAALMFNKIAVPNLGYLKQHESFQESIFLEDEFGWLREQGLMRMFSKGTKLCNFTPAGQHSL